jgi:hypothetical protein
VQKKKILKLDTEKKSRCRKKNVLQLHTGEKLNKGVRSVTSTEAHTLARMFSKELGLTTEKASKNTLVRGY